VKYIDEYRDRFGAERFARAIARATTRPWTIMEVCGGQTHAIVKFGIDELLPKEITLVHRPGCPVCVTPLELIDKAIEIATRPGVIFCSFGDMLRVPGSETDLLTVKANSGDVRIVYSPLDAVRIARDNPSREVVFFAVGFETTAPANAMAVSQADQQGLPNFSLLVSHVLVPPAMEGLPMDTLWRVVQSMRRAATESGIRVVTGDTKVVDKGKGDQLFISTAGIGRIEHQWTINPAQVRPGDAVLLSGDIGRHGMAIMSVREGLLFESSIESDCAPLAGLVQLLLDAGIEIHCLRDLTRGGLASALNEIAQCAGVQIDIDQNAVPVREEVRGAEPDRGPPHSRFA
jgi:hypothetical protein